MTNRANLPDLDNNWTFHGVVTHIDLSMRWAILGLRSEIGMNVLAECLKRTVRGIKVGDRVEACGYFGGTYYCRGVKLPEVFATTVKKCGDKR